MSNSEKTNYLIDRYITLSNIFIGINSSVLIMFLGNLSRNLKDIDIISITLTLLSIMLSLFAFCKFYKTIKMLFDIKMSFDFALNTALYEGKKYADALTTANGNIDADPKSKEKFKKHFWVAIVLLILSVIIASLPIDLFGNKNEESLNLQCINDPTNTQQRDITIKNENE